MNAKVSGKGVKQPLIQGQMEVAGQVDEEATDNTGVYVMLGLVVVAVGAGCYIFFG